MSLNIFAGFSILLACLSRSFIEKVYFGYYGASFEDVVAVVFVTVSACLAIFLKVARREIPRRWVHRWLAASVFVSVWASYNVILNVKIGSSYTRVLYLVLALTCIFFACSANTRVWSGFRRVVSIVPWMLVAFPVLAGYANSQHITWLGEVKKAPEVKKLTLVLLLDELNAVNSSGLLSVLHSHGLNVAWRPVSSIGASTAEAIPAMFSPNTFVGATPCWLNIICANGAALDFTKVQVARPDVDVVGFHHPYCGIKGLRSCHRYVAERSVWEAGRIKCALASRFGLGLQLDKKQCRDIAVQSTLEMRKQIEESVMNSPSFQRGGVLFAHVPLPHPPAEGTGTLADQYRQNINASESMLERLLTHIESRHVQADILIFSDHPLRFALWCQNGGAMMDLPCPPDPSIQDTQVPIILASKGYLPSLDKVTSNKQVFDVLRAWLDH